jgi:hypothetical protein
MKCLKRIVDSALLNRMSHADVFTVGKPKSMVIFVGGSGVDQKTYMDRQNTIIPVFTHLLQCLEAAHIDVLLAHITARYDVPIRGPRLSLEITRMWNEHVLCELLEPWSDLPYIVSGFSGGAALALSGLHSEVRCFGAAVFGADEVSKSFRCPKHWNDKLRIYVTPDDRVCSLDKNVRTYEGLQCQGEAEVVRLSSGGHQLADYANERGLGQVLRMAHNSC